MRSIFRFFGYVPLEQYETLEESHDSLALEQKQINDKWMDENREGRKYVFEIFKDSLKGFRWRVKATNNKIIATSGEGYKTKSGVAAAIHKMRKAQHFSLEDKTIE